MTTSEIKALLQSELPTLIAQDPAVRDFILRTVSDYYAGKQETESKFDRILNELQRDREEQARKWDEQYQLNREILDRLNRESEEQARKWDEQVRFNREILARLDRESEEQAQKWDQQKQKWDEQNRKWDEALAEIRRLDRKHDSTIGAIGARWGLNSEASFRSALQAILQESFGVQVLNVNDFDDSGEVFGQPDQVEIDIIIKNGVVIACEIKSSMSKSDMYSFDRKVSFYSKRHQRPVTRKIVISPMVDNRARPVAERLNIEVYSFPERIENL